MSSLLNAHDQLHNNWQSLRHQWQVSYAVWDDPVSLRFEREFWQSFERVVPETMEEIQRLAEVIAQARRSVH
jgi:hypothetical protein